MQAFSLLILILSVLSVAPSADASCANLTSALEALDETRDFLKPGADHEAGILAGEPAREYSIARRERKKQIQENPAMASQIAKSLGQPTTMTARAPGEILFGLDLLTQTNPKLFVDAVDGMVSTGGNSKSNLAPAFTGQLTSRMISSLGMTKPEDSIRLFDAISKNQWSRQYLAHDNNAPRSMLTAMKQIGVAAKTDPAIAARLPSLKAVVNEWVQPRATRALKGELLLEAHGFDDKMDWAFSRVLANELGEMLKASDPAGAQHYQKVARDLGHARHAEEFAKYPRAEELLEEYGLSGGSGK